jgi:hypothetical protein
MRFNQIVLLPLLGLVMSGCYEPPALQIGSSALSAVRKGDVDAFRETLTGPALEECGTAKCMKRVATVLKDWNLQDEARFGLEGVRPHLVSRGEKTLTVSYTLRPFRRMGDGGSVNQRLVTAVVQCNLRVAPTENTPDSCGDDEAMYMNAKGDIQSTMERHLYSISGESALTDGYDHLVCFKPERDCRITRIAF